jgi:hypothetical protein
MRKVRNNENRFPGIEYYSCMVEMDLYKGIKIIEKLI